MTLWYFMKVDIFIKGYFGGVSFSKLLACPDAVFDLL